MRGWVKVCVCLALAVSVASVSAQGASDDLARAVNFELQRIGAQNPMTRARASDELRIYARRADAAEHLRASVSAILPLLADPLPVVRGNAAVIVALLGDAAQAKLAYGVLRADAASDNYAIRVGVARAAAHIGPTPEVIALLEDLAQNDEDEEVRTVAEDALSDAERPPPEEQSDDNWGFDEVEFFGGVADDDDPDEDDDEPAAPESAWLTGQELTDRLTSLVRRFPAYDAIEAVAQLTSRRRDVEIDGEETHVGELLAPAVSSLMQLVRSDPPPPPVVLRYAARVLGVAGDEAFDALVVALEDEHAHTREAAAFGILWSITSAWGGLDEESRYRDAASALVFSLTDETPAVRAHAADALAAVSRPEYARDLAFALDDPDPWVSTAVAQALAGLEPNEDTDYVQDARLRVHAAAGSDHVSRAGRILEAAVRDADPSYEAEAVALLTAGDPKLALIAAHYLREEGAAAGRAALRVAREDERPWVRNAAGARVPLASNGFGGPGALTGRVVRGAGWEYFSPVDILKPLAGATLNYSGPLNGSTVTDELGRFHVAGATPGRYTVSVVAVGHLPDSFVLVIADPTDPDAADADGAPTVIRLHRHY